MKNKKVILIVGVVFAVLIIGVFLALSWQKQKVQAALDVAIANMTKNNASPFQISNSNQVGLFGAEGVIAVTAKQKEVSSFHYKISSGIFGLLTSNYPITGRVEAGSEVKKFVSFDNNFLDFHGNVKRSGGLDIHFNKDKLNILQEDAHVVANIENTAIDLVVNPDAKQEKQSIKIDSVKFVADDKHVVFNAIAIDSVNDLNSNEIGGGKVVIGSIQSDDVDVNGVELAAAVTKDIKNNSFNMNNSLLVKSIKAKSDAFKSLTGGDDYFFNFSFALNNVSGKLFDKVKVMRDNMRASAAQEAGALPVSGVAPVNAKEESFQSLFVDSLSNGMNFQISDLSVGSKTDSFKLALSLAASPKKESFSFEENSIIELDLALRGKFTQEILPLFASVVEPEDLSKGINSQGFNGSFKYKDLDLTVNDTASSVITLLNVRRLLAQLDALSSLMDNSEAVPESDTTTPVDPVTAVDPSTYQKDN